MKFLQRHHLFYVAALYILWAAKGDFDFDYGFYQLLRFVAFFAFGFAAFASYSFKQQVMPFVLGFFAIVFNPFLPIYLERETWQLFDLISGILLISWTIKTFDKIFIEKIYKILGIVKEDPKGFTKEFSGFVFFLACLLVLFFGVLKIFYDVLSDIF
ncbi:DUF6804 family protein [Acinetobacter haemolyticus]|uniref:DUF6804 family protein n=1 Tax=Acinetobacter haemolyticus TaxID=29430 RepID=UPI001D17FE49|nr:DUF6804 family protein [Acinetobacter haemolyticus]